MPGVYAALIYSVVAFDVCSIDGGVRIGGRCWLLTEASKPSGPSESCADHCGGVGSVQAEALNKEVNANVLAGVSQANHLTPT